MTSPSGVLIWGQAGSYDAVNDRAAITVLANGAKGVAVPTKLTAGSGLDVNVAAWRAVVDCGDGTLAIVGTAQPTVVTPAAGGAAARTDVLWADIDPLNAIWTLNLLATTDLPGRLGVELGRITVPANANASTAFTFTTTAKTWNPFPVPVVPAMAAGTCSIKFNKTGFASVAVKFPTGRFTSTPAIVATSGHGPFYAVVGSPTVTGFTCYAHTYNNQAATLTIGCYWMARDKT